MSLSWLNPLNWGKDLQKSFISEVEHALLYIFTLILNEFLTVFSTISGWGMDVANSTFSVIASAAIALGPFSLPVFSIMLAAIIGSAYIAFATMKDMPIIGAFV